MCTRGGLAAALGAAVMVCAVLVQAVVAEPVSYRSTETCAAPGALSELPQVDWFHFDNAVPAAPPQKDTADPLDQIHKLVKPPATQPAAGAFDEETSVALQVAGDELSAGISSHDAGIFSVRASDNPNQLMDTGTNETPSASALGVQVGTAVPLPLAVWSGGITLLFVVAFVALLRRGNAPRLMRQ